MTTLTNLIERVEAATGADREIDRDLYLAFTPPDDHTVRVLTGFYNDVHDVNLGLGGVSYRTGEGGSGGTFPLPHYTASTDAAIALAKKLLPDCWCEFNGPRKYLHIPTHSPNYWRASFEVWGKSITEAGGVGWGATLPLAILAALLRSKLSESPLASDGVSAAGESET